MALRKEVEQAFTQARIYDLSVEFYVGMPRRMTVPPFSFSLIRAHGDAPDPLRHSSAACLFSMGGHTGTHIDAFNHIAEGGRVYGHPESIFEHESYGSGVLIGAIDETPPILRRGILLDIPRVRGVDFLGPKDMATPDDFRAAEQVENVQVREGDVVLVRTGWMHWWTEDPQRCNAPVDVIPGVGLSTAEWLAELSFRRGLVLSQGDPMVFVSRPISALLLLLSLVAPFYPLFRKRMGIPAES